MAPNDLSIAKESENDKTRSALIQCYVSARCGARAWKSQEMRDVVIDAKIKDAVLAM